MDIDHDRLISCGRGRVRAGRLRRTMLLTTSLPGRSHRRTGSGRASRPRSRHRPVIGRGRECSRKAAVRRRGSPLSVAGGVGIAASAEGRSTNRNVVTGNSRDAGPIFELPAELPERHTHSRRGARRRRRCGDYMVTGVRFRMLVRTFSRFSLGSGIRPCLPDSLLAEGALAGVLGQEFLDAGDDVDMLVLDVDVQRAGDRVLGAGDGVQVGRDAVDLAPWSLSRFWSRKL